MRIHWSLRSHLRTICEPFTNSINELGVQLKPECLEGRCARYRWPRQVFFWDALPKSGYGKIVKKDIQRLLLEQGLIPDAMQ